MNTQIYEEATQWLIKHREAGLDPQQKSAFDTWLRESPQHVRAYLEMSAVWEDVPALDASWNPTADELIARVRSEGNIVPFADNAPSPPAGRGTRLNRSAIKFFAVAATVAIVAVAMTAWHWFNLNTYATEVGEQRSIVLADGTTVDLNSRSRVRIRYTGSQRDVDLVEGQALFRVAHDTARPFLVHSGTTDVRAVGTQFDVYKKRAGTVVTVVEGKVAIVSNTSTVAEDLTAGEQLIVPAGDPLLAGNDPAGADRRRRANVATATAWTQRTLVFDASPLTDVAEEFNRYNTRQLIITDPVLADIRISGMFSSVDPALLLKFLHSQPELQVDETATQIRVSRK
jgi:transmembrane sensor